MSSTCPQSTFNNSTACVPCDQYCRAGPCTGPTQQDCGNSFVITIEIFYIVTITTGVLLLILTGCVICLFRKLRSKNKGRVQNYSEATTPGNPETGHYDNHGYQDTSEEKGNVTRATNQSELRAEQAKEMDELDSVETENTSHSKGTTPKEAKSSVHDSDNGRSTKASVHDSDNGRSTNDQQHGDPDSNRIKYKTWQSSQLPDTEVISPFRTLPKLLPPIEQHKLGIGKLNSANSEMSVFSQDSGYNSVAGNSTIGKSDTLKKQLKQLTLKGIPLCDESTEQTPKNFLDLTPPNQPALETSALFDREGGFLELKQQGVFLFVPPGALNDQKRLFMRVLETRTTLRGRHITPTIKLGPDGIEFNSPVVLSIQHGATNSDAIQAEIQQLSSPWKSINGEDGSASFVDSNALRVLLMHFTGIRGTYAVGDDEPGATADSKTEATENLNDANLAMGKVSKKMEDLSMDDVKEKDHTGARPKKCRPQDSPESVDMSEDFSIVVDLFVCADHFAANKVKLTCCVTPLRSEMKLDHADHRLAARPRSHMVSKKDRKMKCSLAYQKEPIKTGDIQLDSVFKGGTAAYDFRLRFDDDDPSCDITFQQTGGEPTTILATFPPPSAIHKVQHYPDEDDFYNYMLGEKNTKQAGYITYDLWHDLIKFLEPVRPGKDYMAFANELYISPDKARFLKDTESTTMANSKTHTLLVLFTLQMRKEDKSQMDALQTLATMLRNIGQERAVEKVQHYIEQLDNKKCSNKLMESGYLSEMSSLSE